MKFNKMDNLIYLSKCIKDDDDNDDEDDANNDNHINESNGLTLTKNSRFLKKLQEHWNHCHSDIEQEKLKKLVDKNFLFDYKYINNLKNKIYKIKFKDWKQTFQSCSESCVHKDDSTGLSDVNDGIDHDIDVNSNDSDDGDDDDDDDDDDHYKEEENDNDDNVEVVDENNDNASDEDLDDNNTENNLNDDEDNKVNQNVTENNTIRNSISSDSRQLMINTTTTTTTPFILPTNITSIIPQSKKAINLRKLRYQFLKQKHKKFRRRYIGKITHISKFLKSNLIRAKIAKELLLNSTLLPLTTTTTTNKNFNDNHNNNDNISSSKSKKDDNDVDDDNGGDDYNKYDKNFNNYYGGYWSSTSNKSYEYINNSNESYENKTSNKRCYKKRNKNMFDNISMNNNNNNNKINYNNNDNNNNEEEDGNNQRDDKKKRMRTTRIIQTTRAEINHNDSIVITSSNTTRVTTTNNSTSTNYNNNFEYNNDNSISLNDRKGSSICRNSNKNRNIKEHTKHVLENISKYINNDKIALINNRIIKRKQKLIRFIQVYDNL